MGSIYSYWRAVNRNDIKKIMAKELNEDTAFKVSIINIGTESGMILSLVLII